MAVPPGIRSEDGNKDLTAAFLRGRVGNPRLVGSFSEVCDWLGIRDAAAAQFHNFPSTGDRAVVLAWLEANGWLTD